MNEIERKKLKRAIKYFKNECKWYEEAGWQNDEDAIACEVALNLCRAELTRQENAPLTWDEVVVSEGKPVFIYGLEGEHGDDGWSIVGEKYERSGFTFVNLHDKNITNCGLDDLYGKTWLAYRYEPKGEKE